jgi:hypothetical protein
MNHTTIERRVISNSKEPKINTNHEFCSMKFHDTIVFLVIGRVRL